MFSSEYGLSRGAGRKLTKRKSEPRRASMELPERLREVGSDVEEDVTAPRDGGFAYTNQSLISLVTRTGTHADYQSRFDDISSESEGEDDKGGDGAAVDLRVVEGEEPPQVPSGVKAKAQDTSVEPERGRSSGTHRRKLSDSRLLRSLPRLRLRKPKDGKPSASPESQDMLSSQIISPRLSEEPERDESPVSPSPQRDAPLLSRIMKAQAEMAASIIGVDSPVSGDQQRKFSEGGLATLARSLMEVFAFEEPEEVIAEYPCWLLQSVLLQGYMYITKKHVCFYAYLPKKNNVVAKSGYLSKRGKQSPRYSRYWFVLKGDVLSYYPDENDKYFPSGNIDLRYAISAAMAEPKEKSKESASFSVTTHQRTFYLKADSAVSAKEWVKQLQRIIFRSHNDGDSVKICIPINNIIDLEESNVIGFADTVKVRVIDNDETFAVDEYFFAFFSRAGEAINLLGIMIEDNARSNDKEKAGTTQPREAAPKSRPSLHIRAASERDPLQKYQKPDSPARRESVRATLVPQPPTPRSVSGTRSIPGGSGRSSVDAHRRSFEVSRDRSRPSFDRQRSSFSHSRPRGRPEKTPRSPRSPKRDESSVSVSNSLDPGTESSAAIQSIDDTNASASQILNRSDVFETPTIFQQRTASASPVEPHVRRSQDTARSLKATRPTFGRLQPGEKKGNASKGVDNGIDVEDDVEPQQSKNVSSNSLRDLVNAGSAFPLQKASDFAGAIKSQTQRMSTLLGARPMTYYEKVSGMWAGGKRHYGKSDGPRPDDEGMENEDEETAATHERNFRSHFALPETERLQATYFGFLQRVLPLYGKIYVGTRHFCFRSLLPGTRTKLVLPFKDIETVNKEKGFRFGYSGLVVVICGHEELFFEFNQADVRDDCAVTLLRILESNAYMQESDVLSAEAADAELAKTEHIMLQEARKDVLQCPEPSSPRSMSDGEGAPIFFDDPRVSIINFKPTEPMRITCLSIGSRGDVQPYIALCKGLIAEGHKPRIATHGEFESWIRGHGIDFAPVGGNPAELMKICVDNGLFTFSFMKEASSKFRGWLDELCQSAWEACQDSDLLIESPSAMCGIHIAEALEIPYFRAFTMPWTRTRSYPHAFAVPNSKMGGAYNYLSYVVFDTVFWKAIAPQINRFRKKTLGLGSTGLDKMQPNKVPFLYNFSPTVVVPPLDYSDWIRVTGYWFLDEAREWKPSDELSNFIAKAREDEKKLVYVGFGSITVDDRMAVVKTIANAVVKADVRCIWATGWSARGGNEDEKIGPTAEEVQKVLPMEVFQIEGAPHDWLFKQVDAAVHHGGCGTTGASLRAGTPTVIKPFFGDQYFFASRVEDLGVGIHLRKLNESLLARALWEATHSDRMMKHAQALGERIRSEDGVATAIKAIYRDMEYAKTLIKRRRTQVEDNEESWTFIGDESDPEIQRQIAEFTSAATQAAAAGEKMPEDVETALGGVLLNAANRNM